MQAGFVKVPREGTTQLERARRWKHAAGWLAPSLAATSGAGLMVQAEVLPRNVKKPKRQEATTSIYFLISAPHGRPHRLNGDHRMSSKISSERSPAAASATIKGAAHSPWARANCVYFIELFFVGICGLTFTLCRKPDRIWKHYHAKYLHNRA